LNKFQVRDMMENKLRAKLIQSSKIYKRSQGKAKFHEED